MQTEREPRASWPIYTGKKPGICVWKDIARDAVAMNLDDLLMRGHL